MTLNRATRTFTICAVLSLISSLAYAQSRPESLKGKKVDVMMVEEIALSILSPEKAKVRQLRSGDKVEIRVNKPVEHKNVVLVPEGARGWVIVTEALYVPSKRSSLKIILDGLQLMDGGTVPVRTKPQTVIESQKPQQWLERIMIPTLLVGTYGAFMGTMPVGGDIAGGIGTAGVLWWDDRNKRKEEVKNPFVPDAQPKVHIFTFKIQ